VFGSSPERLPILRIREGTRSPATPSERPVSGPGADATPAVPRDPATLDPHGYGASPSLGAIATCAEPADPSRWIPACAELTDPSA